MKSLLSVLALVLILCMLPAVTFATNLLIDQENPYAGYGYGLGSWNSTSTALNNAFGTGNVTVSGSTLDNLSYLMSFDRLWLTARQPGDQLSAAEVSNIQAFIATGRRVVLVGENSSWEGWNNTILQTVGGSYSGMDTSNTLSPVLANSITLGVGQLYTIADGIAIGGTPLFSENIATLWGSSQNVVTLLSVNVLDDSYGANNAVFKTNLANWLAGENTAVPEPSTIILLGAGMAGLAALRLRKS